MHDHNSARRLHFRMRPERRRRRSFLILNDRSLDRRFARSCIGHCPRRPTRSHARARRGNRLRRPLLRPNSANKQEPGYHERPCSGCLPRRAPFAHRPAPAHTMQTHLHTRSQQENSCPSAILFVHESWIPSHPPAVMRMTYAKIVAHRRSARSGQTGHSIICRSILGCINCANGRPSAAHATIATSRTPPSPA
jgi:hypothetical protein